MRKTPTMRRNIKREEIIIKKVKIGIIKTKKGEREGVKALGIRFHILPVFPIVIQIFLSLLSFPSSFIPFF